MSEKERMKPVYLASDHAGFPLKGIIQSLLESLDIPFQDLGPDTGSVPVNWADYGARGAGAVSAAPESNRAILICGSGIGMSIVANKFTGVRGALCHDTRAAEMSRRHNNANILCLGARVIEAAQALEIVRTWLTTPFDGGRHQERLDFLHEHVERPNFR